MVSVLRPTADKLYLNFLYSYILTIIFFDAVDLYPPSIVPASLLTFRHWYISTFNDIHLQASPASAWFRLFLQIELFYQLPVAIWAVFALRRKDPHFVVPMLLWSFVCAFTTIVCIAEYWGSERMTVQQKSVLSALYGGYALFFSGMTADLALRCRDAVMTVARQGEVKKVQ